MTHSENERSINYEDTLFTLNEIHTTVRCGLHLGLVFPKLVSLRPGGQKP